MLDTAEASSPANTRLMFLRALHLYKTGDVGGAAALLREISPNADDAFIATVHRLILGVTLMWPGDADRAWELLAEAARRAEDDDNRLARMCAEGYQAVLAVNRDDIALADRLAGHAESAVGRTLSDSHFVAMFPALARARLELQRADWAGAWRAVTTSVERGRHGAGRVELAAALLTAAAASRVYLDAASHQADDVHPAALVNEARGILRHCADPGTAGHHVAGRGTARRGGTHPAGGAVRTADRQGADDLADAARSALAARARS